MNRPVIEPTADWGRIATAPAHAPADHPVPYFIVRGYLGPSVKLATKFSDAGQGSQNQVAWPVFSTREGTDYLLVWDDDIGYFEKDGDEAILWVSRQATVRRVSVLTPERRTLSLIEGRIATLARPAVGAQPPQVASSGPPAPPAPPLTDQGERGESWWDCPASYVKSYNRCLC